MANSPIHVIVYGDPGAGKSTFAATFPKPMRVWLFDAHGKDTPYLKWATDWKEEVDHYGTTCMVSATAAITIEKFHDFDPESSNGWHRFMRRRDAYAKTLEYQNDLTLVVDSITFMELAARKYDQYVTNKGCKDPRKHFGASTDALEETLMLKLMGLPINVVTIAHIDTERDDVHGSMIFNPSAPGRLKKRIPAAYGEFYHAYVTKDDEGQAMYLLQTRADNRYNASSQIEAPSPSWQSYDSLWPVPA